MRSGFKMKGYSYPGKSPVTQKVKEDKFLKEQKEEAVKSTDYLTKTPVGPRAKKKTKKPIENVMDSDKAAAYENAINDYDTQKPTKAQLAKALQKIKNEKSNKKRSDAERALEAKEDAMGL